MLSTGIAKLDPYIQRLSYRSGTAQRSTFHTLQFNWDTPKYMESVLRL